MQTKRVLLKSWLLVVLALLVTQSCISKKEIVQESANAQIQDSCTNPKKLTFENDTLFFDTLIDGEKWSMMFRFKNTSCDTLKIHQVYTGCSCTASSFNKEAIAPGQQDSIPILFKSKGWGGKDGNLVEKHIYVLYNGGSQVIYFTGIVKKVKKK